MGYYYCSPEPVLESCAKCDMYISPYNKKTYFFNACPDLEFCCEECLEKYQDEWLEQKEADES